jgi:hypothetical protein
MELRQTDVVWLNLSYADLDKLDVTYIFSTTPMEKENMLSELYQASGLYIYKVKG